MSLKESMQQNDKESRLAEKESQQNFEIRSEELLEILLKTNCVEFLEEIRKDLWKIGEIYNSTGGDQWIPRRYSDKYIGKAKVVLEARWPVYVPRHDVYDHQYDDDIFLGTEPAGIREESEKIEIRLNQYTWLKEDNEGNKRWIESEHYNLYAGVCRGKSIAIENLDINKLRNIIQSGLMPVYEKYYNSGDVPHIRKAEVEEKIVKVIMEGELDPERLKTQCQGKYGYLLDNI